MEQTRVRGLEAAVEELRRRGAQVDQHAEGRSRNFLRIRAPTGRSTFVYVKTKSTGDWQTDIGKGTPHNEDEPLGSRYWLFVDLSNKRPGFLIAPESWVENDIYETHQAHLVRHGGRRARSPNSTHHGIQTGRIEQWRDRWDLLGLGSSR